MGNKYWFLILVMIGILGSLYSIVILIFFWINDLFGFNFWNSLICAFGWNLFIVTFSTLLNKEISGKDTKAKE